MTNHTHRAASDPDPELQPYLARDALRGLDHLLAGQTGHAEPIPVAQISAIIRLIVQAASD